MKPWHERVPEPYRVATALFLVPATLLLALAFLNWLFPQQDRPSRRG